MNLFELFAKISMDTSEYESAVKKSLKQGKSLSDSLKNQATHSETLKNRIKVLAGQYDSAKSKVAILTTAFNKAAKEEGVTAKHTQELAKELDDAEKEANGLKEELHSLSSKAKGAENSVSSLSDKLRKGLQTASKIATTILTSAGAAFVSLGKIGLDYNRQMETYTTNFEVMMGDAEAAAKKVEELKEMGAKTPFELGDLANATQTLLAFNVSADDSNSVLTKLGDISLGNVQKLESLTRAYGKMNASQKVTLEDINMMIDAGFNPLLIVAEQTGKTMEEVYDSISKGEVSFDQIKGAIDTATSAGGQFYQGMEKASQTTDGLVSTLEDVTKSKIGEFFEGVSSKITEILPNVISFIENIDVEEVTQKLESLMETFTALLPVVTGITAATVAYKAAIGIAGIIDTVRAATEAQTIAQTLLNAVMNANPFVLIATLIAGLVTALVTLWTTNEDFRNAVSAIWESIKTVFSAAWEKIKEVWDHVKPYFESIWESIKTIFSVVGKTLGTFFSAAWDIIKAVWDAAKPYFDATWEFIKSVFSVVSDVLGKYFSMAWENIKIVWNVVGSYFETVLSTITGIFSVVADVLSGDFESAWEEIQKIFEDWESFFSDLWDAVCDVFANVLDFFSDIGGDIVDGIMSGISDAWNGLVEWFNGIWDSLFGNRSVDVSVNGSSNVGVNGSHASGLSYVPFDGYIAELHKGERVLTAKEASAMRNGYLRNDGVTINQYISAVQQTPVELAATTRAYFEQARWVG